MAAVPHVGSIHLGNGQTLESCTGCTIHGSGCIIFGQQLTVIGNDNQIYANASQVLGNGNTVYGDGCRVQGAGNSVRGDDCIIMGAGNEAKNAAGVLAMAPPPPALQLVAAGAGAGGAGPAPPAAWPDEPVVAVADATAAEEGKESKVCDVAAPATAAEECAAAEEGKVHDAALPEEGAATAAKEGADEGKASLPKEGERRLPLCVACMERHVACIVVPCNHVALCVHCSRALLADKPDAGCPCCRARITRIERVFFA
jgi:hypothetical protein